MRHQLIAPFVMSVAFAGTALAQSATSAAPTPLAGLTAYAPSSGGLDLLAQAAQRYADAKSYTIESVEERTQTAEFNHSWTKTMLTAAEAPGNRSYYKGLTQMGGAIQVSDGKTLWRYRIGEHRYAAESLSNSSPAGSGVIAYQEMGVVNAKRLRENLAQMAKSFKSALRLPDETLAWNGQPVLCHVVAVGNVDQKRQNPDYTFEETLWIDAERGTILKTAEHAHSYMMPAHVPFEEETITLYPKTVLDGAVDESLFSFTPPADARLIQDFPDPMDSMGANMTGEAAPALKLKDSDGKVVELGSFKGKPVLLDFWATWCAPCVASLPQLAEIYKEGKDKGLVLLAVDQDQDAATATSFLAKKGYTWPNFHDGNGEIQKQMESVAIPRVVLVDSEGTIVFDGTGMDEGKLRTHIAKLGPAYAELAPKPKHAPCAVLK